MTLQQRALLLVVPALALPLGGCTRSAPAPRPAVTVEAVYPGANARVVADTVAGPIEQQVLGVEGMLSTSSHCTDDGAYTLTITFKPGTDLNIAQVLVQNRVSLAVPLLPNPVNRRGLTVKKKSPGLLMVVTLSSPDASRDLVFLSSYAALQVRDELARAPGLGDIRLFGPEAPRLRLWLDPERMAARQLTAADVIDAIRQQNIQVEAAAAGVPAAKGEGTPFGLEVGGRVPDPEVLQDVVVKTDTAGGVVRLKDISRVEVATASPQGQASLNGTPVVLLGLYPLPAARPQDVSAAVQDRVAQLRDRCPPGVHLDVAFDFTPNVAAAGRPVDPAYLLVDLALPPGASEERTAEAVRHGATALQKVAGVRDVLALTENPFDLPGRRPCILLRLATPYGDRGPVVRAVRARLAQEEGMTCRLRDLSGPGGFPECGYPIDLAVSGPEADRVKELAANLAERLGRSQKLTDVGANPESTPRPQLELVVDRQEAADRSVSLDAILTALESAVGAPSANDPKRPGRVWQIRVRDTLPPADRVKDLAQLKVRNARGEMVPLGDFAKVQETTEPQVIDLLDGRPMVEVTANPAPDVPLAEARTLCECQAEEARKELRLPADYRLTWLREVPAK